MKEISLEYSFKGERNYVHGTDIYKQLIKNLNALGYDNWQYFELNIRKVARRNMCCFISKEKQRLKEEVGNFKLTKNDSNIYGSLVESSSKDIVTRYPFNDKDITKHCNINYAHKSVTYQNPDNTNLAIDIIISMSKFYLENAVSNTNQWFYRTIKFLTLIDDLKLHKIDMREVVRKKSIVELDLFINNQLVGHAFGASIA